MTCTGTMKKKKKKKKKEIPHCLFPNSQRLRNSSIFNFQNDSTILSYVPKKNKAVILFSTFHNSNEIVIDQIEKLCIILDYNKYKGGVDTLDQIVRCYSSIKRAINGHNVL